MQTEILRANERGHADHGWLNSYHTFSFADYYNPNAMGFRALRVINEDRVAPGGGFPTHGHRDMEIISYVLEGGLAHKDSMGTGSVIKPGDVQRMSAGTGVNHSEMNASDKEGVHFLQIWIIPDKRGHQPGYEQKAFSREERQGKLRVVASPDGRDGSVTIHQDATISAGLFAAGETTTHAIPKDRYGWVQVARGTVEIGGEKLTAGDALAAVGPGELKVSGVEDAEILVFDLA
ncbi:MAG TPA: pirin family protein [Kofleriaceae bacterium]|jgi:redox-sensitive bicupin YhaK (pirin superfamily)|nr:pirin family protein [Kofleriaceae bacterium]